MKPKKIFSLGAQSLLALTLFSASACSDASTTQSSTRDTLAEEVTIPTSSSTTSTTQALGPLPTAAWQETDLTLQPILSLSEPTALTTRPGSDDLWVAERNGTIRQIRRSVITHKPSRRVTNSDGKSVRVSATEYFQLSDKVVLDISTKVGTESEGGLLGIAFSNDGRALYSSYTDTSGDTIVAQYSFLGDTAQAESETVLLKVDQPQKNHNGGQLTIGPDGFLYIALGDGGGGGDPDGNGQNTQTLLGSILRIDPEAQNDEPYSIPDSNPFIDAQKGLPEIWLWGVRNPWRFSFDEKTGDLWVADVGQDAEEEINFLSKKSTAGGRGVNLGWNLREGSLSFKGEAPEENYIEPLHVYKTRENGMCSVTGGYVYRGEQIAFRVNGEVDKPLEGVYLFADYCESKLQGIQRLEDGRPLLADLQTNVQPQNVISFGQGPNKELYILEQGGQISQLRLTESDRAFQEVPANQNLPTTQLSQDQLVLPGVPETEDDTTTR